MVVQPGQQASFTQQVLALGKPTAIVLVSGGALAIDGLKEAPGKVVRGEWANFWAELHN